MTQSSRSDSPEGRFDPAAFMRDLRRQNAEDLGKRLLQRVEKLFKQGALSKERIAEISFFLDDDELSSK